MNPVSTYALQLLAMAALKATGQPLNAATLILFTNNVSLTPDTVVGDLTEATFTGYTAVAGVAFGTPYIGIDGRVHMEAPSADFIMTATTTPETVYGWALVNVGKTALYYAELLDEPVPLQQVSAGLTVEIDLPYGA